MFREKSTRERRGGELHSPSSSSLSLGRAFTVYLAENHFFPSEPFNLVPLTAKKYMHITEQDIIIKGCSKRVQLNNAEKYFTKHYNKLMRAQ